MLPWTKGTALRQVKKQNSSSLHTKPTFLSFTNKMNICGFQQLIFFEKLSSLSWRQYYIRVSSMLDFQKDWTNSWLSFPWLVWHNSDLPTQRDCVLAALTISLPLAFIKELMIFENNAWYLCCLDIYVCVSVCDSDSWHFTCKKCKYLLKEKKNLDILLLKCMNTPLS